MPPILPLIDWPKVFDQALPYADWLRSGTKPENQERMEEARKGYTLSPGRRTRLADLPRRVHIIAIAEDWCGDVVRHVPVLQHHAENSPNIALRFISRAQFPDVFARFLTNGGEAIPKFIFLNDQFVECGNWGPMPADCKELVARGKAAGDVNAGRKAVKPLYESDPGREATRRELLALLEIAASPLP